MILIFKSINAYSVIFQMKTIEHRFPMVLFVVYEVGLTFRWVKTYSIQIKAIEQYFTVVLFITPYKVVLTLESVDEILQ